MNVLEFVLSLTLLGFMTWVWSNLTRAITQMILEAMA